MGAVAAVGGTRDVGQHAGHAHGRTEPRSAGKRSDAGHGAVALGGGGSLEQAVQQLADAVAALGTALGAGAASAPSSVAGVRGGGPAASAGCSCGSKAGGSSGAMGAPPAAPKGDKPKDPDKPKGKDKDGAGSDPGQDPSQYSAPKGASASPDKLSGETSHGGLQDKAKQVLSAAHAAGLKLISGHRPGDDGGHGNGTAVDIANVPGGSKQGSPEMEQFAEAMRAAGKAGDPTVGYVIYRQRIASARDNWAWRPMEDRGSNTANHYDHVHVSTDPNR